MPSNPKSITCTLGAANVVGYEEQVPSLQTHIYTTFHQIPTEWDDLLREEDLLLSRDYLRASEESLHHIRHYYVGFYKGDKICGVACFQRFKIKSGVRLKNEHLLSNNPWLYLKEKVSNFIKRKLNRLSIEMLMNGNAFATGQNAHYFSPDLDRRLLQESLLKAINEIEEIEKKAGKAINVVMLKDFAENSFLENEPIRREFQELPSQPMLVLNIRENWKSYHDYIADFSSKYRLRAKNLRKKLAPVTVQYLDLEECKIYEQKLFDLYYQVAMNAEFNMAFLRPGYFYKMKVDMPHRFFLKGYFLEDKLVGFISWFLAGGRLDAHFLGYEEKANHSYRLYPNMLYELATEAIENGVREMNLGRTASEIKTTIGAAPITLKIYLKHRNPLLNKLLHSIFRNLNQEECIQRHPFKDSKGEAHSVA